MNPADREQILRLIAESDAALVGNADEAGGGVDGCGAGWRGGRGFG